MIGSVVKVDKLNRVVLSTPVCKAVGYKLDKPVYLFTDGEKILVANKIKENSVPRKLDKLSRVAIPKYIREYVGIGTNDAVSITFSNGMFAIEKFEKALEGWKC